MPYKAQKNKNKQTSHHQQVDTHKIAILISFFSHRQILTPLCKPQHSRKLHLKYFCPGLEVNK